MDGYCTQRFMGSLTKTIVPSPVIRWLLHARIRQRKWNDVVFVGHNFIRVYNVGALGHLQHVASKDDFDAQIRAARVFDVEEDPPEEDEFLGIKAEPSVAASSQGHGAVPPQMIVLTLDSNDLVFIYMIQDGDGPARFVHQTCPTMSQHNILFRVGQHLAVDPLSRAVAVAGYQQEIMIYSSKSKETSRHELLTNNDDWCPVKASRVIKINGVIQHMEFLNPPSDDEDHVILLLIIGDQRRTYATWIDWHYSSGLIEPDVHPMQALDSTPSVSSLLIPLKNTAFMLINGSEVKRFHGLLSGSATGATLQPLTTEASDPGISPRQPIWTSWCRPRRSQVARRDNDHFYLAREDGTVCLVTASTGGNVKSSRALKFDCHISTAFASLADSTRDPDILAVAGEVSSGRVVTIGLWPKTGRLSDRSWNDTMEPDLIETIPNWASVYDMMVSSPSSSRARTGRTSDRIFVTSGHQPYGTVTEIRQGLEARMSFYGEVEGLRNATGMWSFSVAGLDTIHILIAGPSGSRLLTIVAESSSAEVDIGELEGDEAEALDLTNHTLLITSTNDDRIVQITNRGLCVTSGLERNFEDTLQHGCEEGQKILATSVDVRGSVIVAAERNDEDYFLRCVWYAESARDALPSNASNRIGPEVTKVMKCEPLAVVTHWHSAGTVIAVATADGRLHFFLASANPYSIREVHQMVLQSSDELHSACDSIVFLSSASSSSLLALCGFRDGRIYSIALSVEHDSSLTVSSAYMLRLGQSAVNLRPLTQFCDRAMATSGAETCDVAWNGSDAASLAVNNIWVSDKMRPELDQGPVIALTQISHSDSLALQQLVGNLLLISGDELMITTLDSTLTTVPRQLSVKGTPNRVLYAEQQRCLVCASMRTEVRQFPTPSARPEERRQVWPVIDFIPPRGQEPSYTHHMQPGERVYALLEWSFRRQEDKDKTYSFILVGGSYLGRSGTIKGKVTFLQPRNESWTVVDVVEGTSKSFEAPVYGLALYDELSYIVCFGQYIQIFRFTKNAWQALCEPFKLASVAQYVTAKAPLVYLSTMKDSHVTLQLVPCDEEDESTTSHKLTIMCTAPRADQGLSHLIVDKDTDECPTSDDIGLMSTKKSQLIGLNISQPSDKPRTRSKSADLLFEANLPCSLTRIRRAKVRPAWRPSSPPGVIADDIIGSAVDGTLVGIALLDDKLWSRLFWLQILCQWDKEISPFSSRYPTYGADDLDVMNVREQRIIAGLGESDDESHEITLRTASPRLRDKHINGDVLARILRDDGAEALKRVVRDAARRNDRIGTWVREHIEEELGTVDEVIGTLQALLHCWL